MLERKNVIFVVKGEAGKGLGHCYRALTVAAALGDDVAPHFVLTPGSEPGLRFMQGRAPQQSELAASHVELTALLKRLQPDLIINDVLNTTAAYMTTQPELGVPIVNFEDLGAGGLLADRVINAVYSGHANQRERYGHEYMDIRPAFFDQRKPVVTLNPEVRKVLLTFGGEDPSDITRKVLQVVAANPLLARIHYKVALGPAYAHRQAVEALIAEQQLNAEIFVNTDIAGLMAQVDLAVIANCRTVFEAAFMRIPAVVISANERECLHTFYRTARYPYCGNINLIDPALIDNAMLQLVTDFPLRQHIVAGLQQLDIDHGLERITREIRMLLRLDCPV